MDHAGYRRGRAHSAWAAIVSACFVAAAATGQTEGTAITDMTVRQAQVETFATVPETAIEALQAARDAGLTISCDMNYRKNLWKWGKKASEVMPDLFKLCDVAVGNEEDAKDVFEALKAAHKPYLTYYEELS